MREKNVLHGKASHASHGKAFRSRPIALNTFSCVHAWLALYWSYKLSPKSSMQYWWHLSICKEQYSSYRISGADREGKCTEDDTLKCHFRGGVRFYLNLIYCSQPSFLTLNISNHMVSAWQFQSYCMKTWCLCLRLYLSLWDLPVPGCQDPELLRRPGRVARLQSPRHEGRWPPHGICVQ